MKSVCALSFFLVLSTGVNASEDQINPLSKVLELMGTYQKEIVLEGEKEQKAYKDLYEWCDEASANLANEIKTGEAKKSKLTAKVDECNADIEVGTSKIEELTGKIAVAEKDLTEATVIRKEEALDFAAGEKELMATIDTLDRATGILEKELAKGGAALAQIDTSNMKQVVSALSVVVDAAAFSSEDKQKLIALVQSREQEDDAEDDIGAPKAAVYDNKSGGIIEVLEDLKEKAEAELAEARKAESTAKHNYDMLKQSITDKTEDENKELDETKSLVASTTEEKSAAEGDLSVTEKDLTTAQKNLATTKTDCMKAATDYEATVMARGEELKVITHAKKILQESTGGAEKQTYDFLQVSASSKVGARVQSINGEILSMVKKLAKQQHSAALTQLASRISTAVRYGSKAGEDPFTKVKGLITQMITKLEKEAEAEATEKAYCDEEMSKTKAKKSELEDDVEKLTTKIDKAASRSAELKEEVAELQSELASLAKLQQQMDKAREESHAEYTVAAKELTEGLAGVRKALQVLRDYFGGGEDDAAMLQDDAKFGNFMQQPKAPEKFEKNEGAGGSIISMLEVVESDFADNLAKEETKESDEKASYEELTQENKVTTAEKDQDVKYKTKNAAALDKAIAEASGDRDGVNTELSAVNEYWAKITERCVAKPETYEEAKARREAEITGLKEALSVLENEAAFLQSKSKRHRARRHFMEATD